MDAWSSPWGEDDTHKASTTPEGSRKDGDAAFSDKLTSAPFSSLSSFDSSDPWATEVVSPMAEPSGSSNPIKVTTSDADAVNPSLLPSATWRDESDDNLRATQLISCGPSLQTPAELSDPETRSSPLRQQSLSSYDPWAPDSSSNWGAEQQTAPSVLPSVVADTQSSGWGGADVTLTPTHELEESFSSANFQETHHQSDIYAQQDADGNDEKEEGQSGESNLDVWAAEASSREEKARRLDREEIDKLKVDARKLISSINTEQETQASFADPSIGDASWTDLFGSQGTQREKLHHLQTPPSTLTSASGALRSDIIQVSPATLHQVRSSLVKTENRGAKLVSTDNNAIWQRGSRPVTKADWLPDGLLGDTDLNASGKAIAGPMASSSSTTSGPGWTQTSSNNETRSTSGPSFLASFFKGRQASATGAATTPDTVSSQSAPQTQSGRNSMSSTDASPSIPTNVQFEPYQDSTANRYSDDPSGPDLMTLETSPAQAPAPGSAARPASARAQGPGLLNRWRNSGLFKSSAKKANPGWAAGSMRGDDLDWLEEQESTDSRTGQYRYDEDEDDSFASFQNTQTRATPPPPPKVRSDAPTTTSALDPFDNLFGPAVQSSLNSATSPAATSSARSSLSASRMSGDGGMMTINTNLGRASSLARKSAASPLQPPPQAQNKRMSIAPPPRANAASPTVANPVVAPQHQQTTDPFADFLSDAPAQQQPVSSSINVAKVQAMATPATTAPKRGVDGAGLTADDLLFFDNL